MASTPLGRGVAVCIAAASLLVAFPGASAEAISPRLEAQQRHTAERLAALEQVISFERAQLVMMEVDGQAEESLMVATTIDGVQQVLDLQPFSVRDANYEVLEQLADGSLVPVDPGPVTTYRGRLAGVLESTVAASLLDDGLHAMVVMPDGDRVWIEPVGDALPDTKFGLYVVYRTGDVLPFDASCGMDEALLGREMEVHNHDEMLVGQSEGGVAGSVCIAQLACDADFEYFQDYGSTTAVQNRINSVINAMNVQYEAQVGLTHQITTIIVRSSSNDPYTSSDSTTLLCQFITEWTNNQGGITRDVAQLFTGRNISGSVIGQAADIGDICNANGCCNCGQFGTDGSYCFVESDFNGNFSCATDLSAHELGHLWNASHCNCPGNTMNPGITCANSFSSGTISSIISYRNTLGCLDGACGTPTGPNNDHCADAFIVGNGVFPYTTLNADTDGPANPTGMCNDFGENQTHHDVWFRYQATCTGDLTVSTCNDIHGAGAPSYDTDMVLYGPYSSQAAISCSGSSLSANLIACNDDDPVNPCGTGEPYSSTIEASVTAGQWYVIRVGGWAAGEQGNGFLSVNCVGTAPVAQPIPYTNLVVVRGTTVSGGTAQLSDSDNNDYVIRSQQFNATQQATFYVRMQAPATTAQELNLYLELSYSGTQPNTKTKVQIRDWANGGWDKLETITLTTTDQQKAYLNLQIPSDYIRSTNRDVRVRLITTRGNTTQQFDVSVDRLQVTVVP